MIYLLVFVAMFALDFAWAFYTKAIQSHRVYRAATFSGIIVFLNGTLAIAVVHEPIMLIPALAGAFSGTVIGMKLHEHAWFGDAKVIEQKQ